MKHIRIADDTFVKILKTTNLWNASYRARLADIGIYAYQYIDGEGVDSRIYDGDDIMFVEHYQFHSDVLIFGDESQLTAFALRFL